MVRDILDRNRVKSYQIADRVLAMNETGSPRFDNAVWPGYNVNITIQISDNEKASDILKQLQDLNEETSNNDELIAVFSWKSDINFLN